MSELIQAVLDSEDRNDLRNLVSELRQQEQGYLLRNDILNLFERYCSKYEKPDNFFTYSNLGKLIYYTQEIIHIRDESNLCFIIRPKIASEEIYRLTADLKVEKITTQELLDLRDRFVDKYDPNEGDLLELDFGPFYDYSPTIRDPKNIGKGVAVSQPLSFQ